MTISLRPTIIRFRPNGLERDMPIRGFLSGQAFEPEVVRQMSLALETLCGKFGMKLADDPATRVVALKIIELAERGVRDAPTLSKMTLKELKHYLPYAEA
jgi:hypothetical protein